jgi:hypothetical protein
LGKKPVSSSHDGTINSIRGDAQSLGLDTNYETLRVVQDVFDDFCSGQLSPERAAWQLKNIFPDITPEKAERLLALWSSANKPLSMEETICEALRNSLDGITVGQLIKQVQETYGLDRFKAEGVVGRCIRKVKAEPSGLDQKPSNFHGDKW